MNKLHRWLLWRTDRELEAEIKAHLESEVRSNIEHGLSPEEARYEALRKFGNATRVRERAREADPLRWLEPVAKDIRYAIRGLARNPGFTAVVVLTLALGIGANTAIFSVADAVWFAPLPYPDSSRVMWLTNYNTRFKEEVVAGPDYFDWHNQARSFDAMMAYTEGRPTLTIKDYAGRVLMTRVTSDFWTITGARPALGRAFGPEESNAAVLGYELFQQRFQGDSHVIGRTVAFDGHAVTIVGVMPKSFQFETPAEAVYARSLKSWSIDVYMPVDMASLASQTRSGPMMALNVIGRRKPGIPVEVARAELQGIQTRIASQNPAFYKNLRLSVLPLRDKLVEGARPALLVLLAAVGFVLLTACANVASLMLARATALQRELSIRTALGAGRMCIVRQSLTESLILALLRGAAGLMLAHWGIAAIVQLGPSDVPRLQNSSLDGWVLGFTLAISLATGLLFGIGPAVSSSKPNLHEVLKESGRTLSSSITARRIRGLLAAGEIALALILLTGAALMIKSFWRMNDHPPGFDPSRTLLAIIPSSQPHYRDALIAHAYTREILRRIQSAPEVVAAGIGGTLDESVVNRDGVPPFPPGQGPLATFHALSAGYLHALGMGLMKGRWITDDEQANVVMINEAAARRVFGDENPLGERIRVPGHPTGHGPTPFTVATIVGVTADLKYSKLDAEPQPEIYVPYEQSAFPYAGELVIRMARDPGTLAKNLRTLISDIDGTNTVVEVKTLEQSLADSIAPRRFNMLLLGLFAGIATLLAAVGIYGVMSYAVTQRTQEIGIRMALGARQHEVVRMVVNQGMAIAIAGLAIGLGAALWLTRLMTSLLYDVKPTDPSTFAAVTITIAATALLACWIPARRAARVDPVSALKYE